MKGGWKPEEFDENMLLQNNDESQLFLNIEDIKARKTIGLSNLVGFSLASQLRSGPGSIANSNANI